MPEVTIYRNEHPCVIIDRSEFDSEADYQAALAKYIKPKKSEQDEIKGKRPEWPMITREDVP